MSLTRRPRCAILRPRRRSPRHRAALHDGDGRGRGGSASSTIGRSSATASAGEPWKRRASSSRRSGFLCRPRRSSTSATSSSSTPRMRAGARGRGGVLTRARGARRPAGDRHQHGGAPVRDQGRRSPRLAGDLPRGRLRRRSARRVEAGAGHLPRRGGRPGARRPRNASCSRYSPFGVEAASAAGMQVIALPDPAMERARYARADAVVTGFAELTPALCGF